MDYKTNWLGGETLTALDYRPEAMARGMREAHYPLQALLYSVALHRFLRWRQPGYDPDRHLGGVLYLFLRGMAGPATPVVDGVPCGVFSWKPPAEMVCDLSDLLDGGPDERSVEQTVELQDEHGPQRVRRATGSLGAFNRAGVLGAADVHVAQRLSRLGGETDQAVLLAAALVVRALRGGSVCLEVATAAATTAVDGVDRATLDALPWPEPADWAAALERSPLVGVGTAGAADRPLRLVGGMLYLDRYWRQERGIADVLDDAAARPQPDVDAARLRAALGRLFPGDGPGPAAAGSGGRRPPLGQRARRRAGHRQDHHRRQAAGGAARTSPGRRCGSRSPHRPARPPPG